MTPESWDDFKKRNYHLADFWPFLDVLNKESDRGAVLVSTGFLEQQLEDVLRAFMLDAPEVDTLFKGGNAPFASFSSRITACYALGLILKHEHDDLHQLRRIRNAFAHDIHTSFQTQSVIDRCATLWNKAHDYCSEALGEVRVDAAGQFRTAATGLILNLVNRPHYVAKERRSTKKWKN